ncbi:vWA domain-containing protein [Aquisalimonas asiatica]|uniref:TIGR03503 family protein n=1 Tax=Aquisalimonas asiatica TaxID=406100 RepID=A0A1H8QHD8_9GAMM|nr:vWA domain-containing protein [Aquisalimonas asiatica]SEO53448.1 TIGR03503 family protein [Aquisalimonas asiatica]
MHRLSYIAIALLLVPMPWTPALADETPQVRVLMDVSASMQRTDPHDLRKPAMRLIAELLPAGADVGVWEFAHDVDVMLPVATVDDDWREDGRAVADAIHSRGQATDIGAALEAAADTWTDNTGAEEAPRHIVLFTDGHVNISIDDDEDAAERSRIIEELMPSLNDRDIAVHTIGLSDEIDQELLEQLAEGTGGRMAVTEDADQLERVFLRLFEQVAPRDSVPLADNTFMIDESVSEMTVLAFRESEGDPVALQTPDGDTLDATMADGDSLRWRSEPHHDLITMDTPPTGEWGLLGADDPDNRVMIVTDLQLRTEPLPPYTIAGESLDFAGKLTEGDTPIDDDDFLAVTRFELDTDDAGTLELPRVDDTAVHRLAHSPEAGTQYFTLKASSETFERETRQQIEVVDTPLIMSRSELPDEPDLERTLRISPVSDVVDTDALEVEITVEVEDRDPMVLRFAEPNDNGEWRIALDTLDPTQDVHITVEAIGEMADGRSFRATVDAFDSDGLGEDTRAAEPHWGLLGGLLFLLNVILFGIIGLVFYLLQGRRRQPPSLGSAADGTGTADTASEKA